MTLLEATIAFVLLSVAGLVCLDQSRAASRLQVASAEWNRAVARGDAAMADALADAAGAAPRLTDEENSARTANAVQVSRRAWRGRVDELSVSVPLHDGRVYTIRRLIARDAIAHSASASAGNAIQTGRAR